jgi:hypothetical protein
VNPQNFGTPGEPGVLLQNKSWSGRIAFADDIKWEMEMNRRKEEEGRRKEGRPFANDGW